MTAPIAVGRKLTRSQVGWLDLLFRGMVSIPLDCTPEEACRPISARTDDRSFAALLNEAMAHFGGHHNGLVHCKIIWSRTLSDEVHGCS